jgi:DNA-binding IclR family transcriptional regulator
MSNKEQVLETGRIHSVSRAVVLLELLAEHGELGVTELGRRLEVHKATASRLVGTLADGGLVERNPATDKFRLGAGVIHLAGAAMAGLDLVHRARPFLEDLAERTEETVNLGVFDGDSVVYVDQIAGTRAIVSASWVGRRTPLHCTSNGKVLLAHLPDADRERALAAPLEPRTKHTVTDPNVLRAQLLEVRVRGYAQTLEELEEGLNAIAAPVRDASGDVIAAVSVAGPAFRMRAADLRRIAPMTVDAAAAISRRMGFAEQAGPQGSERSEGRSSVGGIR